MKPVTILKRARKLIESPARWIKGACARSENGCIVSTASTLAHSFCAYGALAAVAKIRGDFEPAEKYLQRATRARHLMVWNDQSKRTHAQVLAAYDKAIALAEKGAQS